MEIRSKKRFFRGVLSLLLVITLTVVSSSTTFAATKTKKVTSSGKMSVALDQGTSGDSTEVRFNVSGLPANAVITKLEVNVGSLTYQGGMLTNYLTVSCNGTDERIPWGGAANKTLTTSKFVGENPNTTYTISFNSTCTVGAFVGGMNIKKGLKTYSNPYIVIYWEEL